MSFLKKLFGTHSDRELKKIKPIIDKIESYEADYKKLSEEELKAKTQQFKDRLAAGETTDDILPEAFATVREAAARVLGMRPFRVQLIGGVVLHQGRIAEMKTGEGKTLVAVLPSYLNALEGKGVHIVTVNDYLARRDSEWMGKVHAYLGLSVGLIVHGLTREERQAAYEADITYGTNNEMGFDYLRDNLAVDREDRVQRGHFFAIVDEVDSILIDEARTPLIISGPGEKSTDLYGRADEFVCGLKKGVVVSVEEKEEFEDAAEDADYLVDEKARTASLTARGIAKAEEFFEVENLADGEHTELVHHLDQAIKAHGVMRRDIDYVVKDNEVIIVDEHTGRLMLGRRYSDGLHQAIEAKEGVEVQRENMTLATITFQNYFRMYGKLSGMTGTALTEEEEFMSIYNLDIVEIPTNKPVARVDHPDVVYKNEAGKNRAIIRQILECHAKGQPVLVGTVSIEKSEYLSRLLTAEGIEHDVLNAKQHEREAEIVAQAGKLNAVTIATNMAGRGTDITLGGNAEYMARQELKKKGYDDEVISQATGYAETEDETILEARKFFREKMAEHKIDTDAEAELVRAAGGLFILGTERHDARRIDNQLRGRSGRQGDPGESRFFISMTDDIMRLFGGERVLGMMESLGVDEDMPIDAKILSDSIERAQKTVESRNFQARKSTLEYDDVMNVQRNIIYEQRRKVLDGEDIRDSIRGMIQEYIRDEVADKLMGLPCPENEEHLARVLEPFGFLADTSAIAGDTPVSKLTAEELCGRLERAAEETYARREAEIDALFDSPEVSVVLRTQTKTEGDESEVQETFQNANVAIDYEEYGLRRQTMRDIERSVMLEVVDKHWMEHIDAMDDLRQGIGLRAYGNVKPIDAYKQEGFEMFEAMVRSIRAGVVEGLMKPRPKTLVDRRLLRLITPKQSMVQKLLDAAAKQEAAAEKQAAKAAKAAKKGKKGKKPFSSSRPYSAPPARGGRRRR